MREIGVDLYGPVSAAAPALAYTALFAALAATTLAALIVCRFAADARPG